jgi:hypothetical protein
MLNLENAFDRLLFQFNSIMAIFDDRDDRARLSEDAQAGKKRDERAAAFRNLDGVLQAGARAERRAAAKADAAAKRPLPAPEGHSSPPIPEPSYWVRKR